MALNLFTFAKQCVDPVPDTITFRRDKAGNLSISATGNAMDIMNDLICNDKLATIPTELTPPHE